MKLNLPAALVTEISRLSNKLRPEQNIVLSQEEQMDMLNERHEQMENETFESFMERVRDPDRIRLFKLVDDLPADQKQELAALVWLGRGDFIKLPEPRDYEEVIEDPDEEDKAPEPDPEEYERALQHARTFDGKHTALYLVSKPLSKYLNDAIPRLAQCNCELS